jgi:hypothetical protein
MNWYEAQYEGDPAADNVFGREALRPRRNVWLLAWLRCGGLVSDFTLQPAQQQNARIAAVTEL